MTKDFNKFVSVFLGIFALVVVEILIGIKATYALSNNATLVVPLLIFSMLSLGNVLGMTSYFARLNLGQLLNISFALSFISFLGIALNDKLIWVYLGLPLLGFGMFMSKLHAEFDIKKIVWAVGTTGISLYLVLNPLYKSIGSYLTPLALFLILGASFFWEVSLKKSGYLIAQAFLVLIMNFYGQFQQRSFLQNKLESFEGAELVSAPQVNPLLETELLRLPKLKQEVMMMNGSRFAVVPKKWYVDSRLSGGGAPITSYEPPYFLRSYKKVLVIGSAEGSNILAALRNKVDDITAVDINPAVFEIMTKDAGDYSQNFYLNPHVKRINAEGRHFLETSHEKYDLITLQGVQTGSNSNLMNTALLESFLFTSEALQSLWDHLSDDGVVFFDEYKSIYDRKSNDKSILRGLRDLAKNTLPFKDFNSQQVFYQYLQNRNNPETNKNIRKIREGFIFSKAPLGKSPEEIAKKLLDLHIDIYGANDEKNGYVFKKITDQQPFFIQQSLLKYDLPLTVTVIALTLLLVFFSGYLAVRKSFHLNKMALFFIGIAYIQMIMGMTGPVTLLLGSPALVTPVIFTALYCFSLFGGLFSFKLSLRAGLLALLVISFYLIALSWGLESMKPWFLKNSSVAYNVIGIALAVAPLGFLSELPYIGLLRFYQGAERGWAYSIENLGTFIGIPIGLWLQFRFGFTGALYGGALFFLLAFIIGFSPLMSKGR